MKQFLNEVLSVVILGLALFGLVSMALIVVGEFTPAGVSYFPAPPASQEEAVPTAEESSHWMKVGEELEGLLAEVDLINNKVKSAIARGEGNATDVLADLKRINNRVEELAGCQNVPPFVKVVLPYIIALEIEVGTPEQQQRAQEFISAAKIEFGVREKEIAAE